MFNCTTPNTGIVGSRSATAPAWAPVTWNGPVCGTCGRGYDGSRGPHQCAEADLLARIAFLQRKLDEVRASA